MAENPKPDETMILRFEEDLLIAKPENWYGVPGKIQELFGKDGTDEKANEPTLIGLKHNLVSQRQTNLKNLEQLLEIQRKKTLKIHNRQQKTELKTYSGDSDVTQD